MASKDTIIRRKFKDSIPRPRKELMSIKGKTVIVIRDAKTKKILNKYEIENVVTQNGFDVFASRIASPWEINEYTGHFFMMLGTGTGTPSSGDTDLFAPISETKKEGARSKVAYNQVQYYVRYLPEEANGYTFTELGIFENAPSDLSTGVMINHLLIEPPITKTSDILVDFYVNFYLS